MTSSMFKLLAALMLLAAAGAGQSQSMTLEGRLDDPVNTALVGSDLGAPSFGSASDVANNVALYTLNVLATGLVTIKSTGFAAGGVDPYFSLFQGAGGSASFIDSNYVQAFSTGGDFSYSAVLNAGSYRIALGAFANMSLSENLGTGTLADGFTGLGVPQTLGDSHYRLLVNSPVPEPAVWWLLALGLPALRAAQRGRSGHHSG
jgi:hypothetical protein